MSDTTKVAVVTGCSSGIGLASTKAFLEAGYKVFGIDINTFDHEHLTSSNHNFTFHQANLTRKDVPKASIKACKDRFGRVDVLANVAGVMDGFSSADTVTAEEWDRVININLTVPVLLMKEAIAVMLEGGKGGCIVNVSSKAGTSGGAAGVAYTASKHGLIGASKNVAWRFRDENIRCNVISPGGVATNISGSMTTFDQAGYAACMPFLNCHIPDVTDPSHLKIKVDDIANAIVFLASGNAAAISGVLLPIDRAWASL